MGSNRDYRQGIFIPQNPEKCLNKKKNDIVFRSYLEFKVMNLCDQKSTVLEWSSEKHIVPYMHPIEKRMARYFVDFYIKIETPNGIRKCLVEVKPERQTKPPVPSKKKKQSTILYENVQYAINKAKWEAAKQYAKKLSMEFMLLTDEDIDKLTKKIL